MNVMELFAGAGGGILAGELLGWRTRCAVEIDSYCRKLLLRRQRDGYLEPFPIWDDIKTFDGNPWHGAIDLISGGFPCQDISSAGKRRGLSGDRSGLVFEMLRVIGEVKPAFVWAENSPHLRTRGLGKILKELNRMGYDARWCVLGARHIGANHRRDRMWIFAYANGEGKRTVPVNAKMASPQKSGQISSDVATNSYSKFFIFEQSRRQPRAYRENSAKSRDVGWWDIPRFEGMDDGDAYRMDRVRATGNAQVPLVAATAFKILSQGIVP